MGAPPNDFDKESCALTIQRYARLLAMLVFVE